MKSSLVLGFILIGFLLPMPVAAQNSTAKDYSTLPINGITMAYRDIGSGPALVLLHGFTGTGEDWNPFLDDLAAEYRLIVPDMRGHGRSLNPSGQFTHRELAQDVFSLLDQLEIDSFQAIGASMGAMTLLHAATLAPERINAMVLVGGSPYLPESARVIYRESSPDNIPAEELQWMSKVHSGGTEQVMQLMRQFYAYKDSYDDVNFTKPYLASIKASTLIVQGDRDEFFPVPVAIEMYNAIPNSYLWVVPNMDHSAGLGEENGRITFINTVREFLGGEWEE